MSQAGARGMDDHPRSRQTGAEATQRMFAAILDWHVLAILYIPNLCCPMRAVGHATYLQTCQAPLIEPRLSYVPVAVRLTLGGQECSDVG